MRAIPEAWPAGPFDLIVLSEIAYYFDRPALREIIAKAVASTTPGATIVGVHWRGPTNYPLTGDEAHHIIDSHAQLERAAQHRESDFVLDVWHRLA